MLSLLDPEREKRVGAREARESARQRSQFWRAMRRFPFQEPEFRSRRVAGRAAFFLLLCVSAVFGVMVGLLMVYSINLPQMTELERYRPSTTTNLYDIHGKMFGSFASERRIVVPYSEFPQVLRDAIFSIEDKNFESNGGINLVRVVGAAYRDVHSGGKAQGASTLTMQLARNLFLSSEKTFGRKLQEIFLTLQIERHFTKPQIFTLYANQIYLGRGTYGFEAGAEYYFSKHARELTLSEAALLAALPKGPELYSPVRHPERALKRRNLVLSEMAGDHRITEAQAAAAQAEPLVLHLEKPENTEAPYFVEEVRRQLEREYGVDQVHGAGLRVYTTLDIDLQRVANKAVLDETASYEHRRGWIGRLPTILGTNIDPNTYKHPDWTEPIRNGSYFHALVTEVSPSRIVIRIGNDTATLTGADWIWTQKIRGTELCAPGDIVYVRVESGAGTPTMRLTLQQDSGAQASLMAVDNSNGEVLAMVGGRDYQLSQFNRATQAQRQVGSSFKPYDYVAAMEAGMGPYDHVMDSPATFYTPSGPYSPHNYEANYLGSMTLIDAFAESRNIPALRLADKVGVNKVIEVAHRFGVKSPIPKFLPVAIGAADLTLEEQVGAYTVFPNDGIRIAPHYIRRVAQADGQPLEQKTPEVREVISVDIARKMMLLLQAVVQHGTAAEAAKLNHPFGGKTGTTNNYTDAWFVGFSPSITCGTWIGFDTRESLGPKETGAKAALPMWMDFMKAAIADRPNETFSKPNAQRRQVEVPVGANAGLHHPAPAVDDEDDDDGDKPEAPSTPPAQRPANDETPDEGVSGKPAAPATTKPAQGPPQI